MVKSAGRVFQILELVAERGTGCLHSEVAQKLSIPRASVTALLRDLVELGYLTFDDRTKRYALGPQILTLSNAYLRHLNIVQIGEPILREIFREVGEFTSLVIAKDTTVVKVCEYAPPDPHGYHLQVGEAGPMHATAGGKAILAHVDTALRERLLARLDFRVYTARTIRTKAALVKELKSIRGGEPAYCREEYLEGMISMAVPVFDADDRPVAAIGVNTRAARFNRAYERKVDRVLRSAQARLSARLGNRRHFGRELADAA